jgi:hypothetical protein
MLNTRPRNDGELISINVWIEKLSRAPNAWVERVERRNIILAEAKASFDYDGLE